jgi:O-antigen/teichoic acid export membrane protein
MWRPGIRITRKMSLDKINKRGISAFKHFLSGKVISIVLTLGYFVLLTRYLSVGDYSDYVTAIAIAEILIGVSTFGLDWLAAIKIPAAHATNGTEQAKFYRSLLSARVSSLGGFFLVAAAVAFPAALVFDGMHVFYLGMCYALVEGLHRFVATSLFDSALQQRASKRMWIGKSLFQFVAVTGVLVAAPSLLTAETAIVIEASGSLLGLLIAVPALSALLRPVSINLNVALLREGTSTFSSHWPVISASYIGSLLSWVGSISTFVVLARILGGETVAALVGFCATLTNQVRRYLPTEMFLGVVRAFIYARFTEHKAPAVLERDLHLYFGIGLATVILGTSLLSLVGEPIIEMLSNGKFADALPHVLISVGGLAGIVGRRITETGANALGAAHIWAMATTRSIVVVPIAAIAFHFTHQPLVLVLGWIAVDLVTTVVLQLQLARQRTIKAIPVALVMKAVLLLPVLALGYWSVRQTHSLIQHVMLAAAFFGATSFLVVRLGFINLAAAKRMFNGSKA